jgi:hypothetical protein
MFPFDSKIDAECEQIFLSKELREEGKIDHLSIPLMNENLQSGSFQSCRELLTPSFQRAYGSKKDSYRYPSEMTDPRALSPLIRKKGTLISLSEDGQYSIHQVGVHHDGFFRTPGRTGEEHHLLLTDN